MVVVEQGAIEVGERQRSADDAGGRHAGGGRQI